MKMANKKQENTVPVPNIITDVSQINGDNIMEDEVFYFILSIQDFDIREEIVKACTEIAKKARKKTKFLMALDLHEKSERRSKQLGELMNETRFFPEKDRDKELCCGSWIANQKGVRKVEIGKNGGKVEYIASPSPVYVSKVFVNRQDKTSKVELKFKDGKVWKTITPARSTISSTQKITKLADMNLPVTSETARNMVNYFFDLMRLNANKIPQRESTSKLGWMKVGDTYDFMPYDREHLTFDADERFKGVVDSIHEQGSYSECLELFQEIRATKRIEPRIMIDAAVASVLVEPLNLNPFIVHLYGQTEGGKTVCEMLATSIWADPSPEAGYCGNFKTTQVALETRADLLNNLPLILDDTAQISQKLRDDFAGLIYTLCSGTGKDRSNVELGIRRTNTWKSCILTTGEHPLIADDAQGGAMNRVIQIEAGAERIFKDGHHVAETVKKNFGQLGPVIIKAIKILGFEKLNKMIKQYFEEAKQGKMEKQAQSAASLIVADHIVTDAIFHDGDYLTVKQLKPYLRGENAISENLRCYIWLIDQFSIYNANFCDDDFPERIPNIIWGRKDTGQKRVYIYPSALRDIIAKSTFSMESFLKWADRHRVLIRLESKRLKSRVRILPSGSENADENAKKKYHAADREACYVIDYGSPTARMILESAETEEDVAETDIIEF